MNLPSVLFLALRHLAADRLLLQPSGQISQNMEIVLSLINFCLLCSQVKYFIIHLDLSGVRWCGNRRASHFLHLTYGLIYSIAGGEIS